MDLSNPANLVITALYYLLSGILTFFSIFAVYVLTRYGRNTLLALVISLLYGFFFLKILTDSYQTLQGLS